MKQKLNITPKSAILPVLGFALLLLFSPCKVRNLIQAELGTSQTEVSNKSQTVINNASCISLEIASSTLVKEKAPTYQYSPAYLTKQEVVLNVSNSNSPAKPFAARSHSASAVPLYILYQNFKDYL